MVRIFKENRSVICGSVILNMTHILTAATCIINEETKSFDITDLKVVAGDLVISSKEDTEQFSNV